MNIKSLIEEFESLSTIIDQLEIWRDGATGELTESTINNIKEAISGLTLEQAQLILATKELNETEASEILIKEGLLATSEQIGGAKVREALATTTLSEETQLEILKKLDLIEADSGLIISENTCTEAQLRQALAARGVVGANQEQAISAILSTRANEKQAISFDLVAASAKKTLIALATNPLTWVVGATAAVIALGFAIDSTVDSMGDIQKRLDENKEELESYKTKLDELKSKLEEIRDIDALGLSEDEKKSLETTKQNIEDQIELYDLLKKAKEQAVNEDSAKLATGNTYEVRPIEALKKLKSGDLKGALSEGVETSKDMIKNPLNWLLPGSATLFSLMPKETDNYLEQLDKQKNQYEKIIDEFNDANEQLKLDAFNETYLKELEDVKIDKSNKLAEIADTLEHVQEIREQLVNADDGKDYTEQIKKLDEYISEYQGFLTRELDFNLNEASEQIEEVKEKVEELTYIDFSDITTQVTNFTAAQKSLNSALSEQVSNGTITEDTLASLKEQYEGIENAIEFTTDGIILNTEKLRGLNAEQRQNIADELAQKEEELAKQYNEETRKLTALNEAKKLNIGVTDDEVSAQQNIIDKLDSQIADLKILQKEYQNSISTHNAFMEALSSSNEGAGYESIVSSLEKVQEQWDKGLVGTDDIRTFVDYMTSTDMSNASVDEITSQFENAMSMAKEFFTEGSDGSQKFLDLLADTTVEVDGVTKALAEYNAITDTWDINIDDMAQASEATGYSVDFLIDNLNRLKDYGFSVEFGETDDFINYQQAISNVNDEISETQALLDKSGGKSKELKNKLEALNQIKVNLRDNLSLDIFDEAVKKVQELQTQISHLESIGAPTQAIEAKKQQQGQVAQSVGMTVQEVLDVDTSSADSIMEAWKKKTEESDPTVKVDADISQAESAINSVANKTYSSDLILNLKTTGQDTVKQTLNNIFDKAKGNDSSGGASALGTTQFGKSFSDGKIGYTGNQRNVMVGEVAPEMVVDPHNATYTIYSQPTMIKTLPKNAIVFNGKQTSDIIKHGTTPNYGKAYANGIKTGFAFSTSNWNKSQGKSIPNSNTEKNDDSTTKKTNKQKEKQEKKTKQLVDWIERRINVLNTKAERWANTIEKATDPKRIDSYYKKLDTIIEKQIKTYGDAYNRYMSKADTVKLSKSLKNKVISKDSALFNKDGNLKSHKVLIKEYGEKTYQKIQDYIQWIDKATSAIDEFTESSYKLANSPLEKAADKIDLLSKSMDVLDSKLKTYTVNDYASANKTIDAQMTNSAQQNDANRQALITAASKVNAVKNTSYEDLIKNGKKLEEIDVSSLKLGSKKYKNAVKQNAYIKAYNEALEVAQKSENELIKQNIEYRKQQFDNVQNYYDKQLELKQAEYDIEEGEIKLLEARGAFVQASHYKAESDIERDKLKILNDENAALTQQLKLLESTENGKYSEEWYECSKAIRDVNEAINDAKVNLANLNDKMNTTVKTLMNYTIGVGERATNEINFVIDLMGEVENFDMNHIVTNEGITRLGSYVANMRIASEEAGTLHDAVLAIQTAIKKGESKVNLGIFGNLDYSEEVDSAKRMTETYEEFLDKWQDKIKETYDYRVKMHEFVKNMLQEEMSALNELISDYKDALNDTKNLKDYQKNVREQTDNIGSLRKQMSGVSGDTSEEGINRYLQLQKELSDAEKQLEETELDHMLNEQQAMLDKLSEEYQSTITALSADTNYLDEVANGILSSNNKLLDDIYNEYVKDYRYAEQFKNAMTVALNSEDGILTDIKDALTGNESPIIKAITDSSTNIVNAVNNDNANNSNNQSAPTPTPDVDSGSSNTSSASTGDEVVGQVQLLRPLDEWDMMKADVEAVFADSKYYAKGKKKKASDYKTPINQFLFSKNGKVLSDDGLKQLRKILKTDNNNILNVLKDLSQMKGNIKNVGGFAKGGIGKLVKPTGEDGLAWVKNEEGFVKPEDVKYIQDLLTITPQITKAFETSTLPTPLANNSIGDIEFNIEMNGVNDVETFSQQIREAYCSDARIRKMIQADNIGQISGNATKTTRNRYR